MPWKEREVSDLRLEFVLRSLQEATSFAALCAEYGISAKTGYKWKERFLQEGMPGLHDRSRRPHASPGQLPEAVVCRIVALKTAHPTWGARKLREVFARDPRGQDTPSESSFKRVLESAGLVQRRKRRRADHSGHIKTPRPVQQPNDLWTTDFKGWWYAADNQRCLPLTVCDRFSRFVLCATAVPDARAITVRRQFERLFEQFGLPRAIRSDNGIPFAAPQAPLGLSTLSAWWVALGIDLDRIDPGKPYQNGAHERMHLDLAREVQAVAVGDVAAQNAALRTWRHTYNQQRPHEALGMRLPAELYCKSSRGYEGTPDELDYPAGHLIRRVQKNGRIKMGGKLIRLTEALRGWTVGLRPTVAGKYEVYFGRLCLGLLDTDTAAFHPTPNPNQSGKKGKH